jgi:iron(III) transport system permease protein
VNLKQVKNHWVAFSIATITLVPIAILLISLFNPDQEILNHLWQYVLPEVLVNSFWLVIGVSVGVTFIGVTLAWLTSMCDYPGRRFYSWALLLPLSLPAYIMGFIWIGMLDFTGVIPLWLADVWGVQLFPPIRSRWGVILVMTLAFYPYVYLTVAAAFRGQSHQIIEAAQTLGMTRIRAFFTVSLPMAYPGIMAGLLLTMMETLADFGTVTLFNYNTFTTVIYKTWFSLFSLQAASQLASFLLLFVFIIVLLESYSRSRKSYHAKSKAGSSLHRIKLKGWSAFLASAWSALIFSLAFVIPMLQLILWVTSTHAQDFDSRYFDFVWHTLFLSAIATILIVGLSLLLGYAQRNSPTLAMRGLCKIATLGYALPGAVLAVGIYVPVAWLDNQMTDVAIYFGGEGGQILGGTLAVMMLAYCARFIAVGFGPVESGLAYISPSIDEVAQSLGASKKKKLFHVHIPMLRVSLITAAVLTFIDVMKELPISLMTRPFGWDTLAIRVFEMVSEGQWERAALPAITIVGVGLLPIFYLMRKADHAYS